METEEWLVEEIRVNSFLKPLNEIVKYNRNKAAVVVSLQRKLSQFSLVMFIITKARQDHDGALLEYSIRQKQYCTWRFS